MPLPNVYVIRAIVESYLTLRKDNWSLENKETGKLNLPDVKAKPGSKLDICKKILDHLANEQPTVDDYIALTCVLHHAESKESSAYSSHYSITKMLFVSSPLILDMLRAIRSYIITTLASDPAYIEKLQGIKQFQEKYENDVTRLRDHRNKHKQSEIDAAQDKLDKIDAILAALDYPPMLEDLHQDHKTFYKKTILPLDPKSKELHEDTFDDFEKHACQQLRTTPLCNMLADAMPNPTPISVAAARPPQPSIPAPAINPIEDEVAFVAAPQLANPVTPAIEVSRSAESKPKSPRKVVVSEEQKPAPALEVETAHHEELPAPAKSKPAPKKPKTAKPVSTEPVRRSARLHKPVTYADASPPKPTSAIKSSNRRKKDLRVSFASDDEPPPSNRHYKNY